MVPTEAAPQQVPSLELPVESGAEPSTGQETRVINPGYEGLGPFGTSTSGSAGQSSTRGQKSSDTRRSKTLDIASDSWINH